MSPIRISEIPRELARNFGKIENLRSIGDGCTADLASFETSEGKFVIKRSQGAQFTQWLERENQVLRSLASAPLPIPRAYGFYQNITSNVPEAWLVMSYIEGSTVTDLLLPASFKERLLILTRFGEALRMVHSATAISGFQHRNTEEWLEYMLKLAEHNLNCGYITDGGSRELLKRLKNWRPQYVDAAFIHGDYTTDNVLLSNNEFTGIIDWSAGRFGDPRYDLALALGTNPEISLSKEEVDAFYKGYGGLPISEEEKRYFLGLYEFF